MNEPQQQAIEELTGEQFIEWLLNHISAEIKAWDELSAIRQAKPKIERARKFMLQRFMAAEAFLGGREGDPGFLGFAIGNLSESDDPQAESALEILEKRRQEELASGKTKDLWLKLMHALGVTDDEIKRAEPKEATRNYIAELSDVYSNSEWQIAMGAFAAHERALSEEYSAIAEMLKTNSLVSDSDMEVLRSSNMNNSAHVLDKVVFDNENKQAVMDGVSRQLETRREFYAGLAKYLEDNKTA